jgi:hypothetical protein
MARCRHEASALREVTRGGTMPLATRTTTAVAAGNDFGTSAPAVGQNPARFASAPSAAVSGGTPAPDEPYSVWRLTAEVFPCCPRSSS